MPTINYIYHGNQYLCETDENDTPTKLYVNQPGTYTDLVSQKDLSTGEKSYPLYDAVGSTRSVTDDNGDVTDTFVYDAWGNVLIRTGTTDIPFQYVGEYGYYREEDTDDYYVLNRIYSPRTIRWISVDPIIQHLFSSYCYSRNDPEIRVDPSGTQCLKIDPIDTTKCYLYCNASYFGKSREAHMNCIDACEMCRESFPRWINKEKKTPIDWSQLDPCPCKLHVGKVCIRLPSTVEDISIELFQYVKIPECWSRDLGLLPGIATKIAIDHKIEPKGSTHPGAERCIRRNIANGIGQQCCYDSANNLITSGYGAGTADAGKASSEKHINEDVIPWLCALHLDGHPESPGNHMCWYDKFRPKNGGLPCTDKATECPEPTPSQDPPPDSRPIEIPIYGYPPPSIPGRGRRVIYH